MIDFVTIDNFATIRHISFDLGKGFNVITGETGAGKSVLVQAISTALGNRADISMIRRGTSKAVIQIAGEYNGEEVVIQRELLSSGKSHARINGSVVTLAQLREFCQGFAHIHGQYDNQPILNPENHTRMTDRYGHQIIDGPLSQLSALYDRWRKAKGEYDRVIKEEEAGRRQKDYYQFEFDYISQLNLKPGEDEDLENQLQLMKNSARIYEAVEGAHQLLHESEPSASAIIGRCSDLLSSVSRYSPDLEEASRSLNDIYYSLEDVSDTLRRLSDNMDFSGEDMDRISGRLSEIEDAKRKYKMDVDGILAYAEELDQKLQLITNFQEEKDRLKAKMDKAYEELSEKADQISELRHQIAGKMEKAMISELDDLDFANDEFSIKFTRLPEITATGYDSLEFMISTNPGEPLRPLSETASGGEISRIMLAFRHITGDSDRIDTMIFDEIDTGISGHTALTVGRKMKEISKKHQILCITHLPQIAAYGNENFLIEKDLSTGKSETIITDLDRQGKINMLASLFSGGASGKSAEAAEELMNKVESES
ncbi:MAG: DNA repair protein RecN [Baileyella intestinalis]|uniref:DNA repair protein RecN n=1 Tax=Baileyella intestinalis TaxID=2606709 RepID=UPI0023F54F0D|nr:DNA repair protein RecN [Baileyella intestinalis]MDD5874752.1 DNA repair protein RecN [Baileyella intestinalis]